MYFTYETIAFDNRMESGVEASESTAPLALCAFIVMTALAAAIPKSGSFSSISARMLFCGKTESGGGSLPSVIRFNGQ